MQWKWERFLAQDDSISFAVKYMQDYCFYEAYFWGVFQIETCIWVIFTISRAEKKTQINMISRIIVHWFFIMTEQSHQMQKENKKTSFHQWEFSFSKSEIKEKKFYIEKYVFVFNNRKSTSDGRRTVSSTIFSSMSTEDSSAWYWLYLNQQYSSFMFTGKFFSLY